MAKVTGGNSAIVEQIGARSDTAKQAPKTIEDLIKDMVPAMKEAMPKHMDVNRFTRIALTQLRTNPKLRECSAKSLLAAIIQSAQLGLEIGLLGHAYLVPFRNKGDMEVQFIIGYKGMIDLARRSGDIKSINAHEVYENDLFELVYGLDESLKHVPWHIRTDEEFDGPGTVRGAYMVAHFKDGGHYMHYMPVHEINQHRQRSKASSNGPWVSDYIEMCKKTVVRAGWKWLPISIEVAEQVEATDGSVQHDVGDSTGFYDLAPSDFSEGDSSDETAATSEPEETQNDSEQVPTNTNDILDIDEEKMGF